MGGDVDCTLRRLWDSLECKAGGEGRGVGRSCGEGTGGGGDEGRM